MSEINYAAKRYYKYVMCDIHEKFIKENVGLNQMILNSHKIDIRCNRFVHIWNEQYERI